MAPLNSRYHKSEWMLCFYEHLICFDQHTDCLHISTATLLTHLLHTDITTSGRIKRDTQKQGRRDGGFIRFCFSFMHNPPDHVTTNLPTENPSSIQTKLIPSDTQQRRAAITQQKIRLSYLVPLWANKCFLRTSEFSKASAMIDVELLIKI